MSPATSPSPPRKRPGHATGPRLLNGSLLDVETGAAFLGDTSKGLRSKIARGLVPHRRLAGRIVLIRAELEQFIGALPGLTLAEALANVRARAGQ